MSPARRQPAKVKPKPKAKPQHVARVVEEAPWTEIPIFIHGISPNRDPATCKKEYHELLSRVNKKLKLYNKSGFSRDAIFITWGVPVVPAQSTGMDNYLAAAEREIRDKVKHVMGGAYGSGLTWFYSGIRDMIFYGVTDLFYYVSADGERTLRSHVFNYIAQQIQELDLDGKNRFSLTLFGHSAGSVISHDLLFHLFSQKHHTRSNEGDVFDSMNELRKLIARGRLRIRRLYTFGSPISPLILRADSLVKRFLDKKLLEPVDIGFGAADELSNPRWVNFWTRHDLASYPVSFLYTNPNGEILDQEVPSGFNPSSAHTGYWKQDEMAEGIAKTF